MTNDGCLDTLFKCDKTIATENIMETEMSNKIVVFPNPANDVLHIKFSTKIEPISLIIKDSQGRAVTEKTILQHTEQESINVSHLASGIYFLAIKTKEGIIFEKIVIH